MRNLGQKHRPPLLNAVEGNLSQAFRHSICDSVPYVAHQFLLILTALEPASPSIEDVPLERRI